MAASDPWLAIGFHVAAILGLAVLTGVPSYFFHPRRLPVEFQNRSVALSYYARAARRAPLVYFLGYIGVGITHSHKGGLYTVLAFAAVQTALWWRISGHARASDPRGATQRSCRISPFR